MATFRLLPIIMWIVETFFSTWKIPLFIEIATWQTSHDYYRIRKGPQRRFETVLLNNGEWQVDSEPWPTWTLIQGHGAVGRLCTRFINENLNNRNETLDWVWRGFSWCIVRKNQLAPLVLQSRVDFWLNSGAHCKRMKISSLVFK